MSFLIDRRVLRAAVVIAAAGSLGACATVTRGAHQTWTVQTDPNGAKVETSNGFKCDQTPCTFRMKRKASFDVSITKDGYKSYHGKVMHQTASAGAAGMAGNVLVGGLIGIGVDAATGSTQEQKPNPLVVKLEPETAPAPAPAGGQ
jgi:hypothetical protein